MWHSDQQKNLNELFQAIHMSSLQYLYVNASSTINIIPALSDQDRKRRENYNMYIKVIENYSVI